jgi:Flp pilus assembly protein TadD
MFLGKPAEAKINYLQALSLDPSCINAEKEVLDRLISTGEFEAANSLLERLLEIAPQDIALQIIQARMLLAQNKVDEGEQLLQKLIASRPLNFAARALLGDLYLSQQHFVEADEQYRSAAELGGNDSTIYFGWGKVLNQLGLIEVAIEKFQKAAEIDPFNPDIYELWGVALKSLGRFAEAAQVYKQASDYIF